MASGTRSCLKKLEDDGMSKRKTRKLVNLGASSSLKKKLVSTGKKILESPLRRSGRAEGVESSSTSTSSKKNSSPILSKNRKVDEAISSSTTLDKSKKIASPQTKKREAVSRSVSSSTRDFLVSATPQKKKRKLNENNSVSGENDTNGEDHAKKTVRKHLHFHAYKKMFKGQTSKGGPNVSKTRAIEEGKRDAHNEGDGGAETIEALRNEDLKIPDLLASDLDAHSLPDEVNQDDATKSTIKYKKRIPYETLIESSKKEMSLNEICVTNAESSSPIIEELGLSASEVRNDDCTGKKSNVDSKECSIHSQSVATLIPDVCFVCEQPGQLMSCFGKGCKRSYHPSCFGRMLPGAWLCRFCVKMKLESGVYSVSEGIESVWDIDEGAQSGKLYFVKYKGLSHSHNRWIPESELLHNAPSVFAKFRKKGQKEKLTKWRKEWAEPERLLQKRLVILPDTSDEYTSGTSLESSNCCIEWFVKWKLLDYDQATWELEKSLILGSSEAARLVENYEHRCEQAKRLHDPVRREKVIRLKKDPFCNITELPDGCPTNLGHLLGSLNRLLEFWHKSLNAVLFDDLERFAKSILFILSLQCYACQPSLIITTPGSLTLWQSAFGRLAPSLNVLMYEGDKDARKIIRDLEFYEESGYLMFQVLLAEHEAIIEDFGDISCIDWEFLIVDTCQNLKMCRHLERLKSLNADFKLLLFNGQMKDNLSEYCILLSFLGGGGTVDDGLGGLKDDNSEASDALAVVKEKLTHHIAYERKTDSSNFEEYWIPVPLSNVQLEQYCSTLISNSNVLRSNPKFDVVGALHSILITTRKCCDHPYLVDGELRGLLLKGLQSVEFLDVDVRASGKLFFLDKLLHEMRSCGLRVVILFQSLGGTGTNSLGDFFEDFLQQRFGVDSYEHIEPGIVMAKKMAALKMFNDKESGRFVFLIEKRACLQSVKLHFVDAVILFDSDWNPLNDLRSLQKISIESQHNCIKVFRLYTAFTVEEKLLMFAKQDTILDNNVENISRNTSQSLLSWGASYLFWKLDQFHSNTRTTRILEPSFDKQCLDDVILEILTAFPGKVEITRTVPRPMLVKALQNGATYSGNIVLLCEKEGDFPDKNAPFSWSELLEGKYRRWIHISDRSQRIRRKVQNSTGFVKRNEMESGMKKRRKTNIVDPVTSLESSQEKRVSSKGGCHNSSSTSDGQKSCNAESKDREPNLEEQRNLLRLLIPELSELCDILGLPASVKGKAQEFLDYIMNNHYVSSTQVTVLQALKISLCWRAASMSRYRLDRIESLTTAKRYLKYECSEEEANSVYSRLRILKEKFSFRAGALDNSELHKSLDNQSSLKRADSGINSLSGSTTELIDLIEKVCVKRSEDLSQKHQAEVLHFEKQMYEERVQLKKAHDLDLKFVRSIHIDLTVINGKINLLAQEFSSKISRFCQHLKQQRAKLLSMQLDVQIKEHELKRGWLMKAKSGQLEESFDNLPILGTGFRVENFKEISNDAVDCSESRTIILDYPHESHPFHAINIELTEAPTGGSNESEDCCHELASNILSGSMENVSQSDESLTFQSVMSDSTSPIKHSRSSVEPSVLPDLAIVLPLNAENQTPQLDVFKHSSSRQATFVDESIVTTEAVRQECRNNSNIQHSILNQISESTVHPLVLEDVLSERPSPTHLGGTDFQPVVSYADSFSSAHDAIELAQHRILDTVVETVSSNHHITDNTINPSRSQDDMQLGGSSSEHPQSSGAQQDQGNQFFPNFMSVNWVPAQAVHADPFQNELLRIQKQNDSCNKKHEDKKVQLQFECELEIEKLRRKYDTLLQDTEKEHLQDKKMFQEIYEKVLLHKFFAEDARSKFFDHKEGISTSFRVPNLNLSQQLQTPLSHPQLPSRPFPIPPSIPPSATPFHSAALTINQESSSPLLAAARPRIHVRGPPSRTNLPAPHLQRFRPYAPSFPPALATTPPLPSSQVSTLVPSADSISLLPPAITPAQLAISPSFRNSQPTTCRPSPLFSGPVVDQSSQDMEDVDLLESLLLDLPEINDELPASNLNDLRSDGSQKIIYLSDDE